MPKTLNVRPSFFAELSGPEPPLARQIRHRLAKFALVSREEVARKLGISAGAVRMYERRIALRAARALVSGGS
jgi:hypothetical protein